MRKYIFFQEIDFNYGLSNLINHDRPIRMLHMICEHIFTEVQLIKFA